MGEPQRTYNQRELKASTAIRAAYEEIAEIGHTRTKPIKVGLLDKDVKDWAAANGVTVASNDIYVTGSGLMHARRDSKIRDGIDVSVADMVAFPKTRRRMDVYYDGSFVYTDYRNKFIIHPNYEIRMPSGKRLMVNFITARRVTDSEEFNNAGRYTRIR